MINYNVNMPFKRPYLQHFLAVLGALVCRDVCSSVWSSWGDWSSCSRQCGWGSSNRTRQCDNPAPQYDGLDCRGDATEQRPCIEQECAGNELKTEPL